MTQFDNLGLDSRLLKALEQEGYTTPTPIQSQAIPHVLAGRDLLGIAQTGTGKTASFALPILQRLSAAPAVAAPKTARALILSPTRELSAQIADSFKAYGRYMNLSVTTIFGGVGEQPQIQVMKKGIDILVATPGRLLDLVSQRAVDLSKTEIFVLDEADRMLDMGFIRDIRKLITYLSRERQNLFFSATMPDEIGSLASDLLRDPVQVSVTPAATTVERIQQSVIHVESASKRALLVELLRTKADMTRTLVFTRTKHGADKIVRALAAAGIVSSAIHGNKSQSHRVSVMNSFRSGRTRVLVATDIAARGIDVDGVSHVINFDLPYVAESYVHRIGRTARAGAEGIAIAFCGREERPLLRDIEKLTRQTIPSSEWRNPSPLASDGEFEVVQRNRDETRGERGPRREFDGKSSNPAAGRVKRPHRGKRNPFGEKRNDFQKRDPQQQPSESRPETFERPFREARKPFREHRGGEGRRNEQGAPARADRPFREGRKPFRENRSGEGPRNEQGAPGRADRPFREGRKSFRDQRSDDRSHTGQRFQHDERPQRDGQRFGETRGGMNDDRGQAKREHRPHTPRDGHSPRGERVHGERPQHERAHGERKPYQPGSGETRGQKPHHGDRNKRFKSGPPRSRTEGQSPSRHHSGGKPQRQFNKAR